MGTADRPSSDPGLQPERTALAWQRTALALVVGPVVAARSLVPELGAIALGAIAGGLALGISATVVAVRRRRGVPHGAAILLVTALVPMVGGLLALGLLLGAQTTG